MRVIINGIRHHIQFAILSPCPHQIILGWDFLRSASAVISCGKPMIDVTETDLASVVDDPELRLTCTSDFTLSPGEETVISVASDDIVDGDLLIAPTGNFFARGLLIPPCLVRFSNGSAFLAAVNSTTETILLPQNATIAFVPRDDATAVLPLSSLSPTNNSSDSKLQSAPAGAFINHDLTTEETGQLLTTLAKHKTIFDSHTSVLGQTSAATHRIETDGSCIIRRRPYRVSPKERKIIQENVDDMLKRNIVRPSASSWSSPVVLVQKKDGSVRFCVDYRALNKITRKDVYPMPRIDDALDTLQGAEYFSSLDLRSGYWQIPMNEADKEKTAFATPDGLYEFNVMPFGLCNAPATFERMIDNVLRGLKWKTCLCYLDDIVIFSSTFKEHLQRLAQVLT